LGILWLVIVDLLQIIYLYPLSPLLWYGAPLIVRGNMSGTLYAFVHYMGQFFHPINDPLDEATSSVDTETGSLI
jgi:ATP-binding cassette subfamily B protein/subfamily B ATP-binding cassette protein MsbA